MHRPKHHYPSFDQPVNRIGIMQGRLSPPVSDRIQAFPISSWRHEFSLAREAGLDCIEWIYETVNDGGNPIASDEGIKEIRQLSETTRVEVNSICADYFMEQRLVEPGGGRNVESVLHLQWLIGRAGDLGARHIVLPFVDVSSLRGPVEIRALRGILQDILPATERIGTELHLETDLAPTELGGLLDWFSHPLIKANYDLGNSASLGHEPEEELGLLGSALGSVHVKDRILGGPTVPLGAGAVDFPTCFRLIRKTGFIGPYILQVARGKRGLEFEHAVRNREFVERLIDVPATTSR
jgi:hexulose-6-phosphate isomerase